MGSPGSLLHRYIRLGIRPDDDDRHRLRKATLTLVLGVVIALSPMWIATYLALDRPLAAVIPAVYVAFSVAGLWLLWRTKRDELVVSSQVVLMLGLPMALQWVLGGFVHASAVGLWSFSGVLVALVAWGSRAAAGAFAVFLLAVLASGLAEPMLRAAIPPLPDPVGVAFFVLNVSAPLATAFVLLVFFNRERDQAMRASDELLANILPAAVVRELKGGRRHVADRHDAATVLFVDFVSFTPFAERTAPERVVQLLDRAFSALDGLAERTGVEKIKTLGDGYLAAAGVTEPRPDHAAAVAEMALAAPGELRACLGEDWPGFQIRIGMASGPLIAGVIGERRMGFDLWGDTVNTAARMASHAAPGTIQLTQSAADALGAGYDLRREEQVEVKGKGRMTVYTLLGRK